MEAFPISGSNDKDSPRQRGESKIWIRVRRQMST